MKALDIIRDANANLLRNKMRSFLTILAIFIGSFVIILSSGINAGVNDFVDKQMSTVGGDGYLEIMNAAASEQVMQMFSQEINEYQEPNKDENTDFFITDKQLEEARKIDGVKSIDAFKSTTVEYVRLKGGDKRYKFNLNLVPRGNLDMDLSAGRKADPEVEDYEVIIPQNLANAFGYDNPADAIDHFIEIGVPSTIACYAAVERADCITIVEAKIVGIQAPGIMSMAGSRANLSLWNRINEINNENMPEENNRATGATADVDPEKVDEIKGKLKDLGLTAMSVEDEVGQIKTFFDAVLAILTIFGGIALLAAAIGIINTLLMSVQERTREIGLDKALGMSNFRVFMNFALEAIMLGFWGSVFGIAVSVGIGQAINVITHNGILKDLPTFTLVIFTPENLITITLIIMLIALIAGVLPARKASKKDPIDALRYE